MAVSLLPSNWRLTLGESSSPGTEATSIDLTDTRGARSLAVAFFDRGADAFGLRSPIGPAVVRLPAYPTLDDVWALYMLARCEADEEARDPRPTAWEAISHYAEQVRQGFVPERVAPERSVQAVLRSIATATLPKDPQAFLTDALRLCDVVAAKVSGGARLLDDDLVGDEPRLQRHVAFLQEDARVYREDLGRSRRYICAIAARDSEPARTVPLLVIDQPKSRMFKLWARRDASSPDGNGYPLLLVRDAAGEIVLSSDPARELPISWLAPALDEAEQRHGGKGTWYDGARHAWTLVASPREGTKVPLDGVVAVLAAKTKLSLQRAAKPGTVTWRGPAAAAALIGAVGVSLILWGGPKPVARPMGSPTATTTGAAANNDLPGEKKLLNLLDPNDGVRTFTHYAIVVGVCSYGSAGEELPISLRTGSLRHSCNNAWEIAHLLVRDYHYDAKNVVLMIDDPTKVDRPDLSPIPRVGLPPTRHNLTSVIENWSEDHRDAGKEKMTLVFYYSGHGSVVSAQSKGLPYLQLSNWESDLRAHKTVDEAGLPMERVDQLVKAWMPAKHVLYLFDNCHAGWAIGMGPGERLDIQQRWADGITYGIAASGKDQSAWEPGEDKGVSVFTRFLIEGLELHSGGAARADVNDECGTPDHIVTHTELEAYVSKNVPPVALKEFNGAIQEPVGRRLDGTGAGQFLFVAPDVEGHLAKRRCERR